MLVQCVYKRERKKRRGGEGTKKTIVFFFSDCDTINTCQRPKAMNLNPLPSHPTTELGEHRVPCTNLFIIPTVTEISHY